MITLRFTYDIITPESAEIGDFAETGFMGSGGYRQEEPETFTFYSAKEAAKAIEGQCGSVEASCWPLPKSLNGVWLNGIDSDTNYRTGESTSYSAHPEGPEYQLRALYKHLGLIKGQ